MKVVGLTGSILSGKSTVAKLFKAKGAVVIDADKLARFVLEKNRKKVDALFGKHLSRKQIAGKVFDNRILLKKLNSLLHPGILSEIKSQIYRIRSAKFRGLVIIDAPLLVETGLYKNMDCNILVIAPLNKIFERAKKRKIKKEEVISRLACQLPQSKKMKYADFVINNNKGLLDLRKEVEKTYNQLR